MVRCFAGHDKNYLSFQAYTFIDVSIPTRNLKHGGVIMFGLMFLPAGRGLGGGAAGSSRSVGAAGREGLEERIQLRREEQAARDEV